MLINMAHNIQGNEKIMSNNEQSRCYRVNKVKK